jgi:tryptophanyl-tRNA synthetase
MESDEKSTILTGDRPTGKLHLGHYVGSIMNRLRLQEEDADFFYMVADAQALTDNADNPEKVRDNVFEVTMDNLACGMDPNKTIMFIQSQIPEIAELSMYFQNLVTLSRLKQNPTVKTEIKERGFGEAIPIGFLSYPISQAADILAFKAVRIPVGADQLPVIEQGNEIVDSFNRIYGFTFNRIKPLVPTHSRLIGLDGKAKMSKSLGNCIFLSDTEEEVNKKVMQMYTDPEHIHVNDPGKVEGNVVFTYLDVFDTNKEEVDELKTQYQNGGLGDVILKKRLSKVINDLLEPIRNKRAYFENNPQEVKDILKNGTEKARKRAQAVLSEVKKNMCINYFD